VACCSSTHCSAQATLDVRCWLGNDKGPAMCLSLLRCHTTCAAGVIQYLMVGVSSVPSWCTIVGIHQHVAVTQMYWPGSKVHHAWVYS
jgi:hypothetical protein